MINYVKNNIYAIAYCSGKDVIFIDNIENIGWKNELRINQELYEKYKNSYTQSDWNHWFMTCAFIAFYALSIGLNWDYTQSN